MQKLIWPSDFVNQIICGHVLDVLKEMPDECVDTIITSPPYWGLRDYGEETKTMWGGDPECKHKWVNTAGKKLRGTNDGNWKESIPSAHLPGGLLCQKCGAWYGQLGLEPTLDMYIEHLLQITAELKRILKPTGVMFWNHGDCYGGSGCGKGDYRNNNEVSLSNPNLYSDKPNPQLKLTPKCICLQNYRLILRMIDEQGWILRNIIIWNKPNGMPSSVKDRMANKYEPVFMLTKKRKYWFDLDAIRIPQKESSIERVKYKHSKSGGKGKGDGKKFGFSQECRTYNNPNYPNLLHPLGKNPGDVWQIPTQPFPEAHFATFPEKLVEPMIKAGCPQWICKKCGKARVRIGKVIGKERVSWGVDRKARVLGTPGKPAMRNITKTEGWTDCGCNAEWESGIVLDPFIGSGTTALIALQLGRRFIGIDISPKYCEMARRRIRNELRQLKFLF